jgi:hypothetical protein
MFLDSEVANPAFEPADRNRFQRFAHDANAFALGFLRTDATAYRRQEIAGGDDIIGTGKSFALMPG